MKGDDSLNGVFALKSELSKKVEPRSNHLEEKLEKAAKRKGNILKVAILKLIFGKFAHYKNSVRNREANF